MKRQYLLLLSLLSGLLLALSWPAKGIPHLLFIALIPMLWAEDVMAKSPTKYPPFKIVHMAFPGFLIWNILTSWWIYNAALIGVVAAVILNSIFMSAIIYLFHTIHRKSTKPQYAYLALILFWITFEHIHYHWDFNWPWLNLGNGFASKTTWIQWYEYTGVSGGSLWILLTNITGILTIKHFINKERQNFIHSSVSLFTLIALPIMISYIIYFNYHEKSSPIDVTIIQPNLDPYTEQYELSPHDVVNRILSLTNTVTDSSSQLVITPESALQEYIWEHNLPYAASIRQIRNHLNKHPNLSFLVGMSTRIAIPRGAEHTAAARKYIDSDDLYYAANTATIIDTGESYPLHHKSKLTPGVEIMPLASLIKPLEKFALDLGGTIGSLKGDPSQTPFITQYDSIKIAPIICYESIFGEFVSQSVRKGANLICIITNDGWWNDTPGHRQHMAYAKLRAIENRRSIARSANTGISAFINQKGDVMQPTSYNTPAAIRQSLNCNDTITFYTRYGDYLARLATFGSILLVLIMFVNNKITQKK